LAVGGGSVIDTAKAIAVGVPYEDDFWDIFLGNYVPIEALPVGVVLTIPAAGSEGSGNSVITNTAEGDNAKLSLRLPNLLRPVFALMNPELTFTLPPFQTMCGVADMMAHILERYFTNTPDVSLTDRLCEGALRSIMETAPRLLTRPDDYEARANIMWAGTIAHNGICGVGREEDWASHFMEHELSATYDVTHGAGLAVVFPAWMKFMALRPHNSSVGKPQRVAQFAIRVMQVAPEAEEAEIMASPQRTQEVALEGIQRFKQFLSSLGLPTRMSELYNGTVDILALVNHLHAHKGPLIGAYVKLNSYNTATIYRYCCEG
jgi:alcohol dehydrogenase YqhD (iron-dependent ADH family)